MNEKQQNTARKICEQYSGRPETTLDKIQKIDKRAKRPAYVFAYVWGVVSAIVMGCGMSLVMTDIGEALSITANTMAMGIAVGCVGLAMAAVTYPVFKSILKSRRKKFADEIIKTSKDM